VPEPHRHRAGSRRPRSQDQIDRILIALEHRRETTLVADAGREAGILEHLLELMINLRSPAQGFSEVRGSDRGDHELLKIRTLPIGVCTAVEDVEHRHRQAICNGASQISKQWQLGCRSRSARDREAYAQNGIGAELALIGRSVCGAQSMIDGTLIERVQVQGSCSENAIDMINRVQHAFTGIAMRILIAQFDRLMNAGRSARWHGGSALGAPGQRDVDLDRGIAARVQNFACVYRSDSTIHLGLLESALRPDDVASIFCSGILQSHGTWKHSRERLSAPPWCAWRSQARPGPQSVGSR
jgi:hypothetical protein